VDDDISKRKDSLPFGVLSNVSIYLIYCCKGDVVKKIIVSGLINIETTVAVGKFPVEYYPVDYNFFGIRTGVSGVGMNVARALKTLGSNPVLLSITSKDFYGDIIANELNSLDIKNNLLPMLESTPQSVIFYDDEGKRRINLDLKNIQNMLYPVEPAKELLSDTSLAVVCNINFSRGLLRFYRDKGVAVATDVHIINNIYDEYSKDFLQSANILFLSNEKIIGKERDFMNELIEAYNNEIIVIGMGDKGALMYVRKNNSLIEYPAQKTRAVINTVGAGDALFSCFIHYYNKYENPYDAIQKSILFASYKIGDTGAANGFLSEKELEKLQSGKS